MRVAQSWLGIIFLILCMPISSWAQSCTGTFNFTDNGGGTSYNLNSGDRLLINSGTYTGNINSLPTNSLICVNPTAIFQPSSINNPSGEVINRGSTVFPNLALNTGFSFSNLAGTTTFSSNPNFNGATTFYNAQGATITWVVTLQFGGNSSMTNDGNMSFSADFQNSNGSTVINNNRMQFTGGNLNPSGVFTNFGQVVGAGFININSGSTVVNHCSFLANNGFNNNSGSTQNLGYIIISGASGFPNDLWQNNAAFFQGPNGVVVGKRYINSSPITGFGRYYFEKTAGYTENVHTVNQGAFNGNNAATPINFFDTTQSTAPNIFDVQNTAPTNTIRQAFVPPTASDALSSCSSIYFTPSAALSITKTNATNSIVTGSTTTYTITAGNAGPSAADNAVIRDPAAAGLSCTGNASCAAVGGASCAGSIPLTTLQGAGYVIPSFPANSTVTITLSCGVTATGL